MSECRLGLVSTCLNHPFTLVLGELYDLVSKKDPDALYGIWQDTEYLTRFYVKICDGMPTVDNSEEIDYFRDTYKFTRKITVYNPNETPPGVYPCERPILYDLDCMVPVFSEDIPTARLASNDLSPKCVFLVWPESDPITRGRVLNACILLSKNGYYYTTGGRHGKNTVTTSTLATRYLVSRGVNRSNINAGKSTNVESKLREILGMLVATHSVDRVYIAVSTENIYQVSHLVRNLRYSGMFTRYRVGFVCDE